MINQTPSVSTTIGSEGMHDQEPWGGAIEPLNFMKIRVFGKKLEEHQLNNFTGAMLKHHSMQSTKYMSQWIEVKNRV